LPKVEFFGKRNPNITWTQSLKGQEIEVGGPEILKSLYLISDWKGLKYGIASNLVNRLIFQYT